MNILVACEESQRVCLAFRAKGHRAFSCDLSEPSGGHPEYHIWGDVLKVLNPGRFLNPLGNVAYGIQFNTMDGIRHTVYKWDLIIAHPPCTFLCNSGNRWFNVEKYGDKARERLTNRADAIIFFNHFLTADCDKIAIENPIGIMSRHIKPTQIIQPFMFGDHARKSTCLWLRGLPPLYPTEIVDPGDIDAYGFSEGACGGGFDGKKWYRYNDPELKKIRSRTFPGIAHAMAEQWG